MVHVLIVRIHGRQLSLILSSTSTLKDLYEQIADRFPGRSKRHRLRAVFGQ